MKQIKNKLNKINKELKFLQDLEKEHIDKAEYNNLELKLDINEKIDNSIFKHFLGIMITLFIIGGMLLGNLVLTSELYNQYHIEECTCNGK